MIYGKPFMVVGVSLAADSAYLGPGLVLRQEESEYMAEVAMDGETAAGFKVGDRVTLCIATVTED